MYKSFIIPLIQLYHTATAKKVLSNFGNGILTANRTHKKI